MFVILVPLSIPVCWKKLAMMPLRHRKNTKKPWFHPEKALT
jgi:hypothetical protein